MLGHTHVLFGLTTVVALERVTPFIQSHPIEGVPVGMALCLGAATVGALLPDIDAENSTIKTELGLAGRFLGGLMRLVGIKHRGLTHWGITTVVVSLATIIGGAAWGAFDIGLAFALGYISHTAIADAMTIQGVPLLWPRRKAFHLFPKPFRVRTGGPVEQIIFFVMLLVFVSLIPGLITPEMLGLVVRA